MLAVPTLFSADATVATITAVATTFTSSISPPSFNAASLSTAVIAATITLVSATVPAVTSGLPSVLGGGIAGKRHNRCSHWTDCRRDGPRRAATFRVLQVLAT